MAFDSQVENSAKRWKDYYSGSRHMFGKMQGENPELLKLAMAAGCYVELTLSWNKPPLYGLVEQFNEFTGRIFINVGERGSRVTRNFLLSEVKMFGYPTDLFEEWQRKGA